MSQSTIFVVKFCLGRRKKSQSTLGGTLYVFSYWRSNTINTPNPRLGYVDWYYIYYYLLYLVDDIINSKNLILPEKFWSKIVLESSHSISYSKYKIGSVGHFICFLSEVFYPWSQLFSSTDKLILLITTFRLWLSYILVI